MRIKNILATLMVVLIVLTKLSPLLVVSYAATTSIGESIVVGEGERAVLSVASENDTVNREPRITDYEVVEDERIVATGSDYYNNITVYLTGENLTDDNFLTREGLRWTSRTRSELISGTNLGNVYGIVPVYTSNVGDSGRITYVGQTKSGIDLDLVWEVLDNNREEWIDDYISFYGQASYDASKRGIFFIDENFIEGGGGDSISVTYNDAGEIDIAYKIVKHGTMEEMPIVVSFISTDIDNRQGLKTDLANIYRYIPEEAQLDIEDEVIYAREGGRDLHSSIDMPLGSYLGVGFLSSYELKFYAPAPAYYDDISYYPLVRYSMFGSALQAKLDTRVKKNIKVKYKDSLGAELKPTDNFVGMSGNMYEIAVPEIDTYSAINYARNQIDSNNIEIDIVYEREHKLKFSYVNERGESLGTDREYTALRGEDFALESDEIEGYIKPDNYSTRIDGDKIHRFVYKKINVPNTGGSSGSIVSRGEVRKNNNIQNFKPVLITGDNESLLVPVPKNIEDISENTLVKDKPKSGRAYSEIQGKNIEQKLTLNNKIATNDTRNNENPDANNKVRTEAEANEENRTEPRDYFLENTGMSKEEKELFFKFIREVEREANEKYGGDKDKVEHAVANAIAYEVYHNNTLQKMTNDFGEEPNNMYYDEIKRVMRKIHRDDIYKVDFPHLTVAIAMRKRSNIFKEIGKLYAGRGPGIWLGQNPEETMFQLNSMTGDLLTNINEKDYVTNIDGYVFYKHPEFKDMSLVEKIEKYYSKPNLDSSRHIYHKEVLEQEMKFFGFNILSSDMKAALIYGLATSSLGGIALALISTKNKLIPKIKTAVEDIKKLGIDTRRSIKKGINILVNKVKGIFKGSSNKKNTRYFAKTDISTNKIDKVNINNTRNTTVNPNEVKLVSRETKSISNTIYTKQNTSANIKSSSPKIESKISNNIFKNTNIKIEPKKLIKEIPNKVNSIVKKTIQTVDKSMIKPISKNVVKPIVKQVNNAVKKATNIVKQVNNVVKKATNIVRQQVNNTVKNNIVKPAKTVISNTSKKVVSTVSKVVKNTVSKVGNAVKVVSKRVTSYTKGRVVKGRKR